MVRTVKLVGPGTPPPRRDSSKHGMRKGPKGKERHEEKKKKRQGRIQYTDHGRIFDVLIVAACGTGCQWHVPIMGIKGLLSGGA